MSQSSLSRKFARFTKPLRVSLGLAKPETSRDANSPFRRSVGASLQLNDRLAAIENDLDRLISGWNQHLPQILGAVGEARQIARDNVVAHQQIEALRQSINELQQEVLALSEGWALQSRDEAASTRSREPSGMTAQPSQRAGGLREGS